MTPTPNKPMRIFMIAGEHSGDSLGARLMTTLAALRPNGVTFQGIGGPKMVAAGLTSVFPMSEIAVMGPKGAVEIIFRSDLGDPKKIEERTEEYRSRFANPFVAASRGFIDDVIMPSATRPRIARSLAMLRTKKLENPWKKHANIPL